MTFDELVKPADHGEHPDMAGIRLRSPSFGDHQPIPARHAVEGRNDFGELEGKELASGTLVGTYQR